MTTTHPSQVDAPARLHTMIMEIADRVSAVGYQEVEVIRALTRALDEFHWLMAKKLSKNPDKYAAILHLEQAMQPLWRALTNPNDDSLWS